MRSRSKARPGPREVFWRTTLHDRDLSSVSHAGLANNLNDGMAWGLFPLFFAAVRMDVGQIGVLAALYPATWGADNCSPGPGPTASGASGSSPPACGCGRQGWRSTRPSSRRSGTSRTRPGVPPRSGSTGSGGDLGYVLGALVSGVLADTLGLSTAMGFVAAPTFGSGLLVAFRMRETLQVRVVARGRLSWDAR